MKFRKPAVSEASPGKRPFYKYATPETTLAILESGKVRYGSPLNFNDPFEFQSGLHFDFDLDSLHSKVLLRMKELASSKEKPNVNSNYPWGNLILEAWHHYPTHGFPMERWREMSEKPFLELLDTIRSTQFEYRKHWREELLPGIRVFCVTESRDHALMWAHYARDHTGAAFEF